jgi:hypothetical protein
MMVEVRASHAAWAADPRFDERAIDERFVALALVPVGHAFRRLAPDPNGCDRQ